jgi:hypothetical protein
VLDEKFRQANESQSPNEMQQYKVKWENEVTEEIEEQLEATRSDAQGFLEANEELMNDAWNKGLSPKKTADWLINKNTKPYQLGDKFSNDFDYEGMLNMALTVSPEWSIEDLNKLHNSFEAVNYHSSAAPLWKAIGYLKSGSKNLGAAYLIIFKGKVKKELSGEDSSDSANVFAQGGTLAQHRKVSKVMREFKRGALKSHGKVVTDRNQAIAIALNEAGISKKEAGGIVESFRLPAADFVAISNGGIPSYNTPLDHWDLHYENGGKIKNQKT